MERPLTSRAHSDGPVAVALSGGVDSAVAALTLRRRGHDIRCYHIRNVPADDGAQADARRVADALGAPLVEIDLRAEFDRLVVRPFIEEYLRGRTPNPCVRCNPSIKLGSLLEQARHDGAVALATGHYARVSRAPDPATGRHTLRRGRDAEKDQSYYLSRLDQSRLAAFLAPLGSWTKDEARRRAREAGLPVAERSESQDVCFIADDDYRAFIESRAGDRLPGEGEIVDLAGRTLGLHGGAWRFTVGQRRGLGVATDERLYVVRIDTAENRVVVGPREALGRSELTAEDVNYLSVAPFDGPRRCEAQTRYRRRAAPATAEPLDAGGRRLRVVFDTPEEAVTPGQAVVLYEGDLALAGGWIA